MSIQEGDKIPGATLHSMRDGKPTSMTTEEIFAGKKVVLFAVPGAFTPTCSMAHLPGYVVNADSIKAKGVDLIAVHSVNDPHVLNAWNKQQGSEEIEIIADWNADFAKALGVDADMSQTGLGIRAKRYALIVKNGVVTYFGEGDLDVSGAEAILEAL